MCLLERVVSHEPGGTVCLVASGGGLFSDSDGRVPAYVALEWMAQCASAHAALAARAGAPELRGMLLGTRSLRLCARQLDPREGLRVEARHLRGETGLVVFDCSVRNARGEELAAGRINLYAEPLPAAPAS
jgi:predicted hotdog family 3-hydroxylacyl-ACP dehydratase